MSRNRTCINCDKDFYRYLTKNQVQSGLGKYCGRPCAFQHRSQKVKFKCAVCFTIFFRKPSEVKKGYSKACSSKCYFKLIKEQTPPKYTVHEGYISFKVKDSTVFIDTDDLWVLTNFKWYVNKEGYVYAAKGIKLHRLLISPNDHKLVDHINGNPLDNRKYNLREATFHENAANSKIRSFNTSGYKGVFKRKNNKFRSKIQSNHKVIELGTFNTAKEAAKAYDKAAKEYHGEYAKLNFEKR